MAFINKSILFTVLCYVSTCQASEGNFRGNTRSANASAVPVAIGSFSEGLQTMGEELQTMSEGFHAIVQGSAGAVGQRFLDFETSMKQTFQSMLMDNNDTNMSAILQTLLQKHNGTGAKELASIEAALQTTFQALPKNEEGLLAPSGVRYLINRYFTQQHGWLIRGFDLQGFQPELSDVSNMTILNDKAPGLKGAWENMRKSNRALGLKDITLMVAAVESLFLDEAVQLLNTSYRLNGISVEDPIDEEQLREVLMSYYLLFRAGKHNQTAADTDIKMHRRWKFKVSVFLPAKYKEMRGTVNQAIAPLDQERRMFSFEDSVKVVRRLLKGYEAWRGGECAHMKNELVSRGFSGTGRVPLGAFYATNDGRLYRFTESIEYLREVGALDETSSEPHVRATNYFLGPSNCASVSAYYFSCCPNACEGVMSHIEAAINASSATVSSIVESVGVLPSVQHLPGLSQFLIDKLSNIASQNGGKVPLYGRLFAQWLHYAFPTQCPYPHIASDPWALIGSNGQNPEVSISKEQRAALKDMFNRTLAGGVDISHLEWDDTEVLVLPQTDPWGVDAVRISAHLVAAFNMSSVVVLMAIAACATRKRKVLKAFQLSRSSKPVEAVQRSLEC